MNPLDTVVAGLSCREVLQYLNDFLDGELAASDRVRVTAHLAECRNCEKFGGEVAGLIAALRGIVNTAEEIPQGVSGRLRARLAGDRTGGA